MLLSHAGQLHTMDLVGLTLSVVFAAILGYGMARSALRRRRDAREATAVLRDPTPGPGSG